MRRRIDDGPADRLDAQLRRQRWRGPQARTAALGLALVLGLFGFLLLGPQPDIRFRSGEIGGQRFAPSSRTPMQMAFEVRLGSETVVVMTRDPLAASEPGQIACVRESRSRILRLTRRTLLPTGFCR